MDENYNFSFIDNCIVSICWNEMEENELFYSISYLLK